ncbi:MAG: M14 family metallopeptidase [Gemmatimonadota bacterium]|nr:M14 family metallopeptidase [Gemmatimonadota bacterium]
MRLFVRRALLATALAAALPLAAVAQGKLTTPKQFFGHEIGEDYWLPNYTQFVKWWETLARESDRMVLDTIGMTAEGRPQLLSIVSSPENIKNREKYRLIAERLSHAEGLTAAQAAALAKEGKSIIWIDGGLHATEVLGPSQLLETHWQFVSQNDEETRRILNDVIIVFVHANPDGMELVADWYMRESDPKKRNMNIPRLYQKYIGHDNNRDFYANNQPETINMNRALYQEWYPQIMYNHHQTGPAGTVMFAPPFRDPMNYNLHSLILTGLDQVGSAMHARFVAEGKPGVTMRASTLYSTWWNGGLRTGAYYHNIVGLLTETIGSPTPMRIPFVPDKLMRNADLPLPIQPQEWHFRQSIDYSVTANRGMLDFAQRYRETLLNRQWQMGDEMIAAGSRDSWTVWPKRLQAMKDAIAAASPRADVNAPVIPNRGGLGGGVADPKFAAMLRAPELRDPRGYILSADQKDFLTALKFAAKLQQNAVVVHRATAPFAVAGKSYPAGSIVVKTNQAYRSFVIDMFDPQDHPNDFKFPGAPPTPPYDNAGWTLSMLMGVQYDRVLDGFDCPCERIAPANLVTAPAGTVAKGGTWKLSPTQNDVFAAVARFQKAGVEVSRGADGNFYVASNGKSRPVAERAARELGLTFAEGKKPAGAQKLPAPRIALFDRYGGQMPSGHTRWLLEQFGMAYTNIYPQELDAGNLRAKYDIIVFPDGSIPALTGGRRGGFGGAGPDTASLPAEWRKTTGSVTVATTVPQLKAFLEAGGRVVTIGSSTSLAQHLGLPVENYLAEGGKPLPQEKFYVPGSILKASFDTTAMVAKGMAAQAGVFYDNSPVFKLGADAASKGVRRIAWYEASPLLSGWAWGEKYLEGGTAIAEAAVGQGTLYLFGPEVLFRAQPHGTFRLFFNALYSVKPPIQ